MFSNPKIYFIITLPNINVKGLTDEIPRLYDRIIGDFFLAVFQKSLEIHLFSCYIKDKEKVPAGKVIGTFYRIPSQQAEFP